MSTTAPPEGGRGSEAGERRRHRLLRWLPGRLKHQLMALVALALCSTIGLFGAYTVQVQSALALTGLEKQALALARTLASANENPILTDKLDEVEELLLRTMEFADVLDIRVSDAQGHRLSRVSRQLGEAPRAVYERSPVDASRDNTAGPELIRDPVDARLIAWHPVVAGDLIGWVRVEYSTAALSAIRDRILLSTLVACLLACAVSSGLLALWLRRPMRALDTAQEFAVGLEHIEGQQIEVVAGPLETVALSRALNQAARKLFEQRMAVEAGVAAVHERDAKLADTNEMLHTIFALSPDALVSFNTEGCIEFANDAFFRIVGLRPDEVIGEPGAMLDAHWRAQCAEPAGYAGLNAFFPCSSRVDQPAGASADDGSSQPERHRLTLARPRYRVLEIVGVLGHSTSVSRLLYIRDITHQSEVDRIKSEFLSTAAHELRTPMTSIHACVELLLSREFDAKRSSHLLGIAHRQSQAMMTILNELLDLARIEARQGVDFELVSADLGELIAEAVHDFQPPEQRAAPALLRAGGAATVRVDRAKLAQVLRNLLSNAYKYSHDGAVDVQLLEPQPMAADGLVRVGFAVSDRGIGMTREQLSRVCERFYRADASGHVPGTGLGMSIVKELVSLMGGTLALRSTPGEGTTVTVWLPSLPPEGAHNASAPVESRPVVNRAAEEASAEC